MAEYVKISASDKTLWGFAKQKLQEIQGEGAKITNQQIVDAMKAIAKANGQEDGDFDKYAASNFKAGDDIIIPGFHIEHGKVKIAEDAPEVAAAGEEEFAADEAASEDDESVARQNTTLGAALTLGAKGYIKRGNIENVVSDSKKQVKTGKKAIAKKFKSAKGQVMGKIAKTKAQNVRNTAAGKLREARKAKAALEAEQKKLKDMQQQAKTAKGESKKALQKQIETQKDKVAKAKSNKTLADRAASKAKTQVNSTKGASNAARKTAKKATKKAAEKAATKAGTKAATKAVAKAGGKTLLKKIPGVSFFAGLAFAADRAMHGDVTGAVGEVASGTLGCIPGIGTAASVAIDVGLAAKDLKDAKVI